MDGVSDVCDRCPMDRDPEQLDSGGDGLCDGCEGCPLIAEVADNHVDRNGDGRPTCAGDRDDTRSDRAIGEFGEVSDDQAQRAR